MGLHDLREQLREPNGAHSSAQRQMRQSRGRFLRVPDNNDPHRSLGHEKQFTTIIADWKLLFLTGLFAHLPT